MTNFPIVNDKDDKCAGMDRQDLPAFYMEDFSRLGFRVSDCAEAIRILDQQAIRLNRGGGNTAVCLEGASQVAAVVRLFAQNGVRCDIADVADGMYQG